MATNIRIGERSYARLLSLKHRLEKGQKRTLSLGAAVKWLLDNKRED